MQWNEKHSVHYKNPGNCKDLLVLEMCQYLEGFYQINNYLKCPIAADCEGDYEVYRSETQNLLPIFLEFDGIS